MTNHHRFGDIAALLPAGTFLTQALAATPEPEQTPHPFGTPAQRCECDPGHTT